MDRKKIRFELVALRVASGVSVALALFKIGAGLKISSIALQTSGIDSLFDALISGTSFFLLKLSHEPADKEHPYGHSRIATLASLGQGVILSFTALMLANRAFNQLHSPFSVHTTKEYLIAASISSLVTLLLWIYMGVVVSKTNSQIVAADRLHYFTDLASNLLLFAGYFLGFYIQSVNLDSVLAIILCSFILAGSYHIIRTSILNLVDQNDPEIELQIAKLISSFYPNALGFKKLRSRKAGHMTAVDLELLNCRYITLEEANKTSHTVEKTILNKIPNLDLIIHTEPCGSEQCLTSKDCILQLKRAETEHK